MKTGAVIRSAIVMIAFLLLFSCASFPIRTVQAQDSGLNEHSEKYSREELAQMLAPIALYPDTLLSQVLMASTYPIEIVEADRWVRKNSGIKEWALDGALLKMDWAPSVKAICHFPEVLALMSERIGDTADIGRAFLVQEADVMNMIQELRAKAYAEGNLENTSNRKVIVEKEAIIIEPRVSTVIYVPYYDPCYVYGSWWYPSYPPYCWRPHGSFCGFGISYWPAYRFSFAFGYWSRIDWHRNYIYIDARKCPKFVRRDRWKKKPGRWHHSWHKRKVFSRDKSASGGYGRYTRGKNEVRRVMPKLPANNDGYFRGRFGTSNIGVRSSVRVEPKIGNHGSAFYRFRRERKSNYRVLNERKQGAPNKTQHPRIIRTGRGAENTVKTRRQRPSQSEIQPSNARNLFEGIENGSRSVRSGDSIGSKNRRQGSRTTIDGGRSGRWSRQGNSWSERGHRNGGFRSFNRQGLGHGGR